MLLRKNKKIKKKKQAKQMINKSQFKIHPNPPSTHLLHSKK